MKIRIRESGEATDLGGYGYRKKEDAEKPVSKRCKCTACYRQFTSHGPACVCLPCMARDKGTTLVATPCWYCKAPNGWFFDPGTGSLKCLHCSTVCKQDMEDGI